MIIIKKYYDGILLYPNERERENKKENAQKKFHPSHVVCILFMSVTTDTDIKSVVTCWYVDMTVYRLFLCLVLQRTKAEKKSARFQISKRETAAASQDMYVSCAASSASTLTW